LKGGFTLAAYWAYINRDILDIGYYAGTYEMSATKFAQLVSEEIKHSITASDLLTIKNDRKLHQHTPLKHIVTGTLNR
jgi:hypothetical protein